MPDLSNEIPIPPKADMHQSLSSAREETMLWRRGSEVGMPEAYEGMVDSEFRDARFESGKRPTAEIFETYPLFLESQASQKATVVSA